MHWAQLESVAEDEEPPAVGLPERWKWQVASRRADRTQTASSGSLKSSKPNGNSPARKGRTNTKSIASGIRTVRTREVTGRTAECSRHTDHSKLIAPNGCRVINADAIKKQTSEERVASRHNDGRSEGHGGSRITRACRQRQQHVDVRTRWYAVW